MLKITKFSLFLAAFFISSISLAEMKKNESPSVQIKEEKVHKLDKIASNTTHPRRTAAKLRHETRKAQNQQNIKNLDNNERSDNKTAENNKTNEEDHK